jgi:hypothetical protein
VLPSSGSCVSARDGERLISVSPEGHAWLLADDADGNLRVLDAFAGEIIEQKHQLAFGEVTALAAWTSEDASVVADGGAWRLKAMARVALSLPEGAAAPSSSCGDPADNGALVSGGTLLERRPDGRWWSLLAAPVPAPHEILAIDGECQSQDNLAWVGAADGTLHRVGPAAFTIARSFDGLRDWAATGSVVAALDASGLWVGPDAWQLWTFAGEVPRALGAASGYLWMASGAQLLRSDGASFVEIEHPLAAIDDLRAHDGGVWLLGDGQVCHRSLGPAIRVHGVRPNQRVLADSLSLELASDDDGAVVTATLDGSTVPLEPDEESRLWRAEIPIPSVGWHELTLATTGPRGASERLLSIKRVPEVERSWSTDVQPIYLASCATGGCHGSPESAAPDLSTVDAWRANAAEVRTRVVDTRTMPPAASIGPEWDEQDVNVIAQWLEGGMLP